MPIRVVPVVDLRSRRSVHARGGDREKYGPLTSVLVRGGDPLELVLAYRDVLGLGEFYVADLDAIAGKPLDRDFLRRSRAAGLKSWVDAGLKDGRLVGELLADGAGSVIAATETLDGPDALGQIVACSAPGAVIFGLDLRDGRPLVAPGSRWRSERPEAILDEAIATGVRRVLILDTGRVGSSRGVGPLATARDVTRRWPEVEVSVGGGVASIDDLRALEDVGVSNVLIGSALHNGTITAERLRHRGGAVTDA